MDWSSVRVSKATKARLEALRQVMVDNEANSLYRRFETDSRDRVGLEQVIVELLNERERHAARKRAHGRKRREFNERQKKAQTAVAAPGPIPEGPGPAASSADGRGEE